MARRGISALMDGFNEGYDTANKIVKDYQMGKIANAQENTVNTLTSDDADKIKALAAETNPDGTPKYTIGFDGQSGYQVTPNQTPDQPTDSSTSPDTQVLPGAFTNHAQLIKAMPRTTFLGKDYEGPLTDQQKDSARIMAQSGVYAANGDPEKALALRQQAQQMDQAQKQGQLTDLQIGQAQRAGVRDQKADAHQAVIEGVDKDVGDWTAKRLTNPDGTQRDMSPDDMLAAGQYRVAKLVAAGKMPEANAMAKDNLQMALTSIQAKTAQRTEAINQTAAAVAQGDYSKLPAFYDQFVPDGAHITNVTQDPKTGKVTIERQSLDGRTLAPKIFDNQQQVIAGLQMLNDPNALYNLSQTEFQRQLHENADKRGDKQLDLEKKRVGYEGQRVQLAKDAADAAGEDRDLMRTAGVAYEKARQAGDQSGMNAATLDIIKAGGTNPGSASANDPAEVKLARALMQANPGMDMKSALQDAISKKGKSLDEIHQSFVEAGIKNMSSAEDSVKKADDVMTQMGYKKSGGRWTQAAGADAAATPTKPANEADALTQAQAAVAGGADKAKVNARLKSMGFKTLN